MHTLRKNFLSRDGLVKFLASLGIFFGMLPSSRFFGGSTTVIRKYVVLDALPHKCCQHTPRVSRYRETQKPFFGRTAQLSPLAFASSTRLTILPKPRRAMAKAATIHRPQLRSYARFSIGYVFVDSSYFELFRTFSRSGLLNHSFSTIANRAKHKHNETGCGNHILM